MIENSRLMILARRLFVFEIMTSFNPASLSDLSHSLTPGRGLNVMSNTVVLSRSIPTASMPMDFKKFGVMSAAL